MTQIPANFELDTLTAEELRLEIRALSVQIALLEPASDAHEELELSLQRLRTALARGEGRQRR